MIKHIKTKSGIDVIFDKLDNISTCSAGVFVRTGSRDESDNEWGISHVLEHMIFKGTEKRNYEDISKEVDYLGSNINAYTTKEETVFYITSLTEYLEKSIDVLFDIVINSKIDEKELEREKDVIVEEIKMYQDTPDDQVFELNYKDSILGQYGKTIIGTVESVKSFSVDEVKKYYNERYTKNNIVIVLSGNFDENMIERKVDEYFGEIKNEKIDRRREINFDFKGGKYTYFKDINQVNICISYNGKAFKDNDKILNDIVSNIIGGSMSSRLFQEIREKRGLAYSVYTYNQTYKEGGVISTYIGTNKESYEQAIDITIDEFKKLKEFGITQFELEKAKNKFLSKIAFSMENPKSRMSIIGNYYNRKNEIINIEDIKKEINEITLERVNNFVKNEYSNYNVTVLGNIKGE